MTKKMLSVHLIKYKSIAWVVCFALLAALGLGLAKYWRERVLIREASDQYQWLLIALSEGKDEKAQVQAHALRSGASESVYKDMATLYLSQDAVFSSQLEVAKNYLQELISKASIPFFKNLATFRLARILKEEGDLEQALNMVLQIQETADPFLKSLLYELQGDCLFLKEDLEGAKQAYQQSVQMAEFEASAGSFDDKKESFSRPLLKLKIDQLGLSNFFHEQGAGA